MSKQGSPQKRATIHDFRRMKAAGEKVAAVTAYDATTARLVDEAGVDAILVGDSVGMVMQGHGSTLPVTLEQMIYHCAAVQRGLIHSGGHAQLIGDMPFGSYQASPDDAVKNAVRFVAEGGVSAVKLEGGGEFAEVIRRIIRAGIPVMGHIGLTPQSIHRMGGYVVQGKDAEKAQRIIADAKALQEAGCYALVLECIPAELAKVITGQLDISTIGIGAGPHCDGQVLVVHDLLGLDTGVAPRFVKRYAEIGQAIGGAVRSYVSEVKTHAFPAEEHCFHSTTLRVVEPAAEDPDDPQAVQGMPV